MLPSLPREFAGFNELDESCGGVVEDELLLELNPSCIKCSSLVWSTVVFDRFPTHRYIRALRRAFQVTGRQACLRVIALLRRDEDREHILVLLRSFALHHWPLPLWGSWIFAWA